MAGYSWSLAGAGFISGSVTNQTVDVRSASGCNTNFTLTLIVTDTNGCTSTCDQMVIVQDIPATDHMSAAFHCCRSTSIFWRGSGILPASDGH